ncbi:acyltransferase [Paraglaciecola agarilytica]|uniref:acyltransferase n=1 Tax=Paraglaciecola chathamensis TaxID=368405 RepID=UPI001C0804E9|nr:acyltransferase [Paraglaciecola agarilytica]MBU3017171.1 acyltransferase [Paraglaciecola agarilytica]
MKKNLKMILNGFFILLALPLILIFKILAIASDHDALFSAFSQFLSLFPGKTGSYLRVGFYRFIMNNCHSEVVISFATLFSQSNTVIGRGVYVGPQCNIGKCTIKENCLIGSGVHILSGKGQHNFNDLETPLKDQGGAFKRVVIGEDTWLGNGAIVMANIGKKCIVAAGAIVVNDIPDYSIVAGNPAKIIRRRNQ